MEHNEQFTKPITLIREDFIKSIIDLCNNSGLPFFVVEDVMKDLVQKIHLAAQQQLEEDKKKYQEKINSK